MASLRDLLRTLGSVMAAALLFTTAPATDLSSTRTAAERRAPSDVSAIDVLIVAPHPDDDTITAAGITMRAAAAGQGVRIVYMTNGDFSAGPSQGLLRESEAVSAAVDHLGLQEDDLLFLGYPDAYLRQIDQSYPDAEDLFVAPWGQSVTYAGRGLGGTDYHSYRFGSPALYNRASILTDLEDILSSLAPRHIFLPSEWDKHGDHSTTYALVSEALATVHAADPSYVPTVHKTIVWADDLEDPIAWPAVLDPTAYHVEVPHLDETDLAWADRESIDVPLAMQAAVLGENPKFLAIASIPSQGGTGGLLGRFVHRDEFFWVENQVGANRPPRVDAGPSLEVSEGVVVQLDGTGSTDPDGPGLLYQWIQIAGTPVPLSDDASPAPLFTAPSGLSADEWLEFQLIVSDGELTSIPDLAFVKVIAAQPIIPANVAQAATVTASTENPADQQEAVKAVDGVADGWPGDYTREWATLGEREGAWIQFDWSRPYSIDRIVVHDRPNDDDQVLAGTLSFSDASSATIGPLENSGGGDAISFPPKVITSLRLTVDAASATTINVGLSEILVFRTQSPDWDGDDWTIADGDCNDTSASIHPGASDATCDGVDQDCDGTADDGVPSQPTTCGVGACGATGAASCVDGQMADSCSPGTPSAEVCDGIDNDCNGSIDDGVSSEPTTCGVGACGATGVASCIGGQMIDSCSPGSPSAEVCDGIDDDCNGLADDAPAPSGSPTLSLGKTLLVWTSMGSATGYDVVNGDLGALRSSGGAFASAAAACLGSALPATSLSHAADPAPGHGVWFVVRAMNCGGAGSYDGGGPSQAAGRDAGIAASGAGCP